MARAVSVARLLQAFGPGSKARIIGRATAEKIHEVMKDARMNRGADDAMAEINRLLDGHGVEGIDGKKYINDYWHRRAMLHVNFGDPYVATVIYNTATHAFSVGSWGDWVEAYERRHGQLDGHGRGSNLLGAMWR